MAVAKIKTTETDASVENYLNKFPNEQKRKDSFAIIEMMKKASGQKPKMWGSSLIGFGNVRVKSPATGREVDWFLIGFAPRKANLTFYLPGNVKGKEELLKKLGKYKTNGGCLYINKLDDVDLKVLKSLIEYSLKKGWTVG